jgi:hypothetical protein
MARSSGERHRQARDDHRQALKHQSAAERQLKEGSVVAAVEESAHALGHEVASVLHTAQAATAHATRKAKKKAP